MIEILLSTSIFVLVLGGIVGAIINGSENARLSGLQTRATLVSQEALEVLRNIRDSGFSNLANGTYGLSTSSSQWNLAGSSDAVDVFTRSITLDSTDQRRKDIRVSTVWTQNIQRTASSTVLSRLTDWRRSFGNWGSVKEQSSANVPGSANTNAIAIYSANGSSYALIARDSSVESELFVLDISTPSSPALVGSVELGAQANDVAVSGHYAIIASSEDSEEVAIVDLTTPSNPQQMSSVDLSGNANALSVAVSGTTIYIGRAASSQEEVYALSLTDPENPTILSSLDLGSGNDATKLAVGQNGANVYVASPGTELYIVSAVNPSSLSLASFYDASGGSNGTAVTTFSTYAVLGRADGTVSVIDTTNPLSPTLAGTLDTGSQINDLTMGVGNLYAFAAGNTSNKEIQIISLATPNTPILLGSLELDSNGIGIAWDFDLNRALVSGSDNTKEVTIVQPQ